MTDSLIKEGVLYYKKQGGRGIQKWIKRYGELYEQSKEGVTRVELYEIKDLQKKGGQKALHTLSLKSCVKICQSTAQKSQKYIIELIFDEKIHLLAVDTQEDLDLWIAELRRVAFNEVVETFGCTKQNPNPSPKTQQRNSPSTVSRNSSDFGMQENSLYSTCEGEETFYVTVKPDEFSERLKLEGEYKLVLGTQRLAIHEKTGGIAPLYVWPYKFLRRYGRDRGSFSMEGGRRCEPGPGKIIFNTLQGNEIFQKVQYYVKDMSATTTLNRDSTNNMTGLDESQPPLPARGYLDNQEQADIYVNDNRDTAPVQRHRVASLESSEKMHSDRKKIPATGFLKHLDKTLQSSTPIARGAADGQAHPHVKRSNSVDPLYTAVPDSKISWKGQQPQSSVVPDYGKQRDGFNEAGGYSELKIQGSASDLGDQVIKKESKKEKKKAEIERKKLEKEKEKENKRRMKELEKKKVKPKQHPHSKDTPSESLQYEHPNAGAPVSIQPDESYYEDTTNMSIPHPHPQIPDANVYDHLNRASNFAASKSHMQPSSNDETYDRLNRNLSAQLSARHPLEDATYDRLDHSGPETAMTSESGYDILSLTNDQSEGVIPVRMDDQNYISADSNFRFRRDDKASANEFEDVGQDQAYLYSTAH
ncbi:uncharacterized protein LOC117123558 [Anneissia japonica]|uniref:uncharacterized protein LOC117123558 n=1 Tax=Anneissia japonica TaxID=1529436 RepID=UPI001425AC8F|nr:uncharacterized protein LOC117123558 [Anneissia japonica]